MRDRSEFSRENFADVRPRRTETGCRRDGWQAAGRGRSRAGSSVDGPGNRAGVVEWFGVATPTRVVGSIGRRSSRHEWGNRFCEVGHLRDRVARGGVEGEEDRHQGVAGVEGEGC